MVSSIKRTAWEADIIFFTNHRESKKAHSRMSTNDNDDNDESDDDDEKKYYIPSPQITPKAIPKIRKHDITHLQSQFVYFEPSDYLSTSPIYNTIYQCHKEVELLCDQLALDFVKKNSITTLKNLANDNKWDVAAIKYDIMHRPNSLILKNIEDKQLIYTLLAYFIKIQLPSLSDSIQNIIDTIFDTKEDPGEEVSIETYRESILQFISDHSGGLHGDTSNKLIVHVTDEKYDSDAIDDDLSNPKGNDSNISPLFGGGQNMHRFLSFRQCM